MARLRVIHKPAGYEAWKDEKVIGGPNYRVIFTVLGTCFMAGCACMATLAGIFASMDGEPQPLPTQMAALPSVTPAFQMVLSNQNAPTITPSPTMQPTPDLNATLAVMLAEAERVAAGKPTLEPKTVTVEVEPTREQIFCEGAPFDYISPGSVAVVTFQQKSALRLLDSPRVNGQPQPEVVRQLYDGHQVQITGEPVCGRWQGDPVVYFPVVALRFNDVGYVGFGQGRNVWLVVAG
ncbi:MAG: hypothetical protein AAFV33_18750 [Chloroflexota bacterium]